MKGWNGWMTVVTAALLAGAACTATALPAANAVRTGPPGAAFYTPPSPLPAGQHGDLIWARPLHNAAALSNAAQNWLILYRSTRVDGAPTAVSGVVSIPKGTPPKGGWPVISWTHGTVGLAAACAPSRNDGASYQPKYIDVETSALEEWIARGYAVVRTDYEGLGTPGPDPYLVGGAEARAATDIVYAARQLDPSISRDWIVMGHSQGGGAAVFTSAIGPVYGSGLDMKAAVAISPDAFVSQQMQYVESHLGSLPASPMIVVMFEGVAAAAPGVNVSKLLAPDGLAIQRVAQSECVPGIAAYQREHKITRMDQVLNLNANFSALNGALETYVDTQNLRPRVPLLVLQASNDEVAVPKFTAEMVNRFKVAGADVDLHEILAPTKVAGSFHSATIPDTLQFAMQWVGKRLPAK